MIETRAASLIPAIVEGRAGGSGAVVAGIAVPFLQLSQNLGGFVEEFAPTAFAAQADLGWEDVEGRFQHVGEFVLASTRSGSLALDVGRDALRYRMQLPSAIPYVAELVGRGDLNGASITFYAVAAEWSQPPDAPPIRTVTEAVLVEVSVTGRPAYAQTSAELVQQPGSPGRAAAPLTFDEARRQLLIRRQRAYDLDRLWERRRPSWTA
jgi:HK97 family phage prohead protease